MQTGRGTDTPQYNAKFVVLNSTALGMITRLNMTISTVKGLTIIILFAATMLAGGFWYLNRVDPTAPANAAPKYAIDCFNAIESNNPAAVGKLIDDHPDLLKFEFGPEGSALHVAARLDRREVVKMLMDRGATIGARGQWAGTPLHWACWWGSKSAAEELLARGAAIEDKGDAFGSSPLLWLAHGSANSGNAAGQYKELAEMLIERGAAADTRNREGVPAIIMAAPDVAKVLKDHGAKAPEDPDNAPATQPKSTVI